jgi:hypothetical protein
LFLYYGPVPVSDTVLSSPADVVIFGESAGDQLGLNMVVADLNDDTYDDLIAVANWADGHSDALNETGDIYVFYGGPTPLPATIDLQTTPSAPDIIIHGPSTTLAFSPQAGGGLASGDVNNDGIDDLLIYAPGGDRPDLTANACGVTWVIFGSSSIATHFDLDTDYDVRIVGVDTQDSYWSDPACSGICDYGYSHVATGDVNCDNIDDILILSPGGDGPLNGTDQAGEVRIIYGSSSLSTEYDLALDADVVVYGANSGDRPIYTKAGDINDDLCDDIIISSRLANGPSETRPLSGELAVIHGSISLPPTHDMSFIPPDLLIYAGDDNDRMEFPIISDIDNNGVNELIFSAYLADGPNNSRTNCGEVYVFFRPDTLPAVVDLATGPADVILFGGTEHEWAAKFPSLATADLNDDGQIDLFIGAPQGNDPVGGWPGKVSIVDGNSLLDTDTDSDGVSDGCDNCPGVDNFLDGDADCVTDVSDNCPDNYNPLQEDWDSDGLGDSCYLPVPIRPMRVVVREVVTPIESSAESFDRFPPTNPELNLIVTDPDGLKIGADILGIITNTIGDSASYSDITLEDSIQINDPKTGNYIIEILPEDGSIQSGRSYTVSIRTDGTVEAVIDGGFSPTTGVIDTIAYLTTPLMDDNDADGVLDGADNCTRLANPDQEDTDGDGKADSCFVYSWMNPLTFVARDDDTPEGDPEINLWITDPEGLVIGADSLDNLTNTIGVSATYNEISASDSIVIENIKNGIYTVEVIPEAGSNQAAQSYTVGVRTDGTVESVLGPYDSPTSGVVDSLVHLAESYFLPYVEGDADGSGAITIADVTFIIAYIFAGGAAPIPLEAGDADCSGAITIADATYLIAHIFSGGPAPGCP